MKHLFTRSATVALAAVFLVGAFSSCHDEEVENISELAYRHNYESNFVKLYGDVNPNQTWDLSSYAKRYNLNGGLTRATMEDTYKSIASEDSYYHIPSELTTYITQKFPERQNNADKVKAFVLKADKACTFEVAYAYQGRSEPGYDLYCAIWDTDKKVMNRYQIFSKGDVEVSNDSSTWNTLGTTWRNNDAPSTQDYSYARSKPYRIDAPANSFIYFFVEMTVRSTQNPNSTSNQFCWIGDELASIDDPMTFGLVEIETPANIKAIDPNYEAYLLALDDFCLTCQDKGYVTDQQLKVQDFNDVQFLIAGNVPEPSTVFDDVIETIIAKRYMIEDLYAYDYDFNDIVVDATQTTRTPYTYTHPTPTNPTGSFNILSDQTTQTQKAKMTYLCGTLPFQVKIGTDYFGQVTDPTDATLARTQLARGENEFGGKVTEAGSTTGIEVGYEKTITSWDPSTNNISAYIWTKGTSPTLPSSAGPSSSHEGLWPGEWTGVWTSEFPKAGDVPYIIAVDQDVDWMGEKEPIPADWIGGDMTTPSSSSSSDTTNP